MCRTFWPGQWPCGCGWTVYAGWRGCLPRMSGGLVTPRLFARKNSLRLVITDSMWKKNIPVMSAHAKRPRNLRTGRVLAWNVGGLKT